jgi:hypothetical protein
MTDRTRRLLLSARILAVVALLGLTSVAGVAPPPTPPTPLEAIQISADGRGFAFVGSGRPFAPWGFNYDHDPAGRLLEDYWENEWTTVEADFREMKELGANVVRVHLQFGRFMRGPADPDPAALRRLRDLVALAERTGLYLNLTGLACYHKADVPSWYETLGEEPRWAAQAEFWPAIARTCRDSPAIFCYDLMNEPVVPGAAEPRTDWLGPAFAGKHFVQFITLDRRNRPTYEIAVTWIRRLTAAIRRHDPRPLITVGLVHWSLDRPGLRSGFIPDKIAGELDFLAVHLYPERGKLAEAMDTLRGFAIGKPVVIEETFPLKCTQAELGEFIAQSRSLAAGHFGFYWGKTIGELSPATTVAETITRQWLEYFQAEAARMRAAGGR